MSLSPFFRRMCGNLDIRVGSVSLRQTEWAVSRRDFGSAPDDKTFRHPCTDWAIIIFAFRTFIL
jgi:hypothetical protein